jgi:hypothetical protein
VKRRKGYVHIAVNQVYRDAGFEAGYRTGRGIGYAYLEKPELKTGDKTPLEKKDVYYERNGSKTRSI